MAIVAAREKEGPEMEHGYAAYGSHPYKNITIHIGGITLKQSKEGVTEIYFSKLASPEYWKDSGEIHFKTSDTELTLTSDIALKGDIPEPDWRDGRIIHCDKIWHNIPCDTRSIDIGGRTHAIFGRWNYRGGVRSEKSFSIFGDDHFWIDRNFRLVDFKISHKFWL